MHITFMYDMYYKKKLYISLSTLSDILSSPKKY